MLRVRVLGALELEQDGEPVALPARRPARTLLGWLALHPGAHPRSTVAGALWPDVLDESARGSLRSALSSLRAAIGADALIATRERIGLADGWVDVREFEALRVRGAAHDALALCRGELLPDFDDEWVLLARDEHRERQAALFASLQDAAAAHGDHATATEMARARTALDPLDEVAHRALMRALTAAGDRAQALAAYERLADRLRRELGVAPSTTTRALAARLRSDAPRVNVGVPARLAAARRHGGLYDRDEELARLRRLWRAALRGGRRLALVAGEPGIGKTRLVAELAAEATAAGAPVLYGRAEKEALIPYQPLVECLREPLRETPTLPPEAAELAALLPELGAAPVTLGREPAPGAALRLLEAFGAVLDTIAAGRPLLLILDDLQWAEPPAVRALVHLAGRPEGAPRAVVAAYRDTSDHPFGAALADLHRELPAQQITLGGLSTRGIAAMSARQDAEALRERTAGNPFFVEQLLRSDATGGVTEVVSERIGALGHGARALLDAAAVTGPEFDVALVGEVVGLPVDAALDVLDAAVLARLVAEVPAEPGRFAFVHALVRDTLAGALTAARRARLHELIDAALGARAGADPIALAGHAIEAAEGGADPERATALALRAADRVGAAFAHEDAALLLQRALAMLERRGAAVARRAEVLCALGEALGRAGMREQAGAAFRRAGELAERGDLLARAALGGAGAGITILGTDTRLVAELERALASVESPVLRVQLLSRLTIELAYAPDAAHREALSAEALALAQHTQNPAALAAALNARHVALWAPEHTEERLAVATEMLTLAERAGDRELALQARNWRVLDLFELGDGIALRAELDAYATLSAQVRLPVYAWYVPLWRATLALLEGRIADGLALARRARDLGRRAGDANADVFHAEQELLRLIVEGRIGDAIAPEAIVDRAEHGPAWQAYRLTFAWVAAERGDLDEARRHYDAALADGLAAIPRDVNWLPAMNSAACACVELGDVGRARELRALLEPYADRMIVSARGSCHAGSVAFVLARLAAACGDRDEAARRFREAARRDAHAGARAFTERDIRGHHQWLNARPQPSGCQRQRTCA